MKKKTLFLPTNAAGVNWWRMILFFKNMQKLNPDMALYGYLPKDNGVAKWENLYEADKLGQGIRSEIHQLMRWCDTVVMGFARYPSTVALIEEFRSTKEEEILMTKGPKRIVCDIDDFVEDTPVYNPAYQAGWKSGGVYGWVPMEMMRNADVIVNATEWLADQHRTINKNSIVIPNSVDPEWWDVKIPEKKSKKIRIGWCGGGNHDEDFRVMPRVIERILKRYKHVEFYFVHGAPEYIRNMGKGVKWDNDWSCIEDYPKFLANYNFDIGIAPLDYNRFNMGKSNIKWLEYSMLGIPGVYSNYEPYKAIASGVDGFRVDKIQEWVDRLSELIESEDLRITMGKLAKERVLKDFNIADSTQKYMSVLEN